MGKGQGTRRREGRKGREGRQMYEDTYTLIERHMYQDREKGRGREAERDGDSDMKIGREGDRREVGGRETGREEEKKKNCFYLTQQIFKIHISMSNYNCI